MWMMSDEGGGDSLSQDEIDALLDDSDDDYEGENGDEGGEFLTDQEKDVMGEIGNIAMGSAATALYTLMDKKVEITSPQVEVREFSDIRKEYDRPIVLVNVEYTEGLEGYNLLVIKHDDAAIIADLMMGGDGTDADEELGELHISAVGEAMNQMMGSASTSLSKILDQKVNITPPEAQYLELDDVIEQERFFDADEELVVTSFQLKIGDLVDSEFQQLAPVNFVHGLVEELVGDDMGLTAKSADKSEKAAAAAMEKIQETQKEKDMAGAQPEVPEKETVEEPAARQDKTAAAASAAGAAAGQARDARSGKVSGEREVQKEVQKAEFPDFEEGQGRPLPQNMELIKDVPLQVTVRLGKSRMTIEEILDLGEGSIIELDKLAGETVDLLVNGKLIAKGEVVVIDENFGFRVKDIVSPQERLNNI
ncbi:flagellar motor switch protein FliN/FliY [Halarsenatibacter silvermanii]|uniref:Flagellar motor switch protein FliN/FliY n=2 Tax=Halarsenatibacter silvermanii TaxID=321763 RepID=A0A1G9MIV3_9FIRM|nr:flagellar motor switch protein FliN/FliY [Halarsenatibacter silvermanii]